MPVVAGIGKADEAHGSCHGDVPILMAV